MTPREPVVLFFHEHPQNFLREQVVYPRHPGVDARARAQRVRRLKQWGASVLLGLALLAMVLA